MKTRNIIHGIIITSMLACVEACEIESHSNGKLDGFWHLTAIDTLATGGTCDMSSQKMFWSVQSKLLELSDRSSSEKIIFSFRHADDSLYLTEPRVSDRRLGDPEIENVSKLSPYGVNKLEETFAVEALDGSKMILKSETLRLKLKRF